MPCWMSLAFDDFLKGRIVLLEQTIGFALCGSFCTHAKAMGALEDIRALEAETG